MLGNHLKVSLRTLVRNRTFSFINILGLALGITIFLLIAEYVAFEWGANRFHKNYDILYRASVFNPKDEKGSYYLPPGLAQALQNKVPGIKAAVRIGENLGSGIVVVPADKENQTVNKSFAENKISFVEGNFLQVFSFPVLQGSASLAQAQTMAISADVAKKYFGNANPVGRVVNLKNQFGNTPYTITAVYQNMPQQSDIQADILLSFKTLENPSLRGGNDWADPNTLNSGFSYIYLLLDNNSNYQHIEKLTSDVVKQIAPDNDRAMLSLKLQPMRNLHLAPNFNYNFQTYGNLTLVISFVSVAMLIMVIAWLNYINLSTAQTLYRAKESGVRKVLGASRMQIIGQYLTETAILTLLSLAIAIGAVKLIQPFYNNFLGKSLSLTMLANGLFLASGIAFIVTGCFLAGGYVSFVLSSFNPLKTIRGKANLQIGGISLRRILVVFQFTTSVILIIATIILYRQLSYMQSENLGMSVQQRVVITGPSSTGRSQKVSSQAFENQIRQLPYVEKMSGSNEVPGHGYNFNAQGITRLVPATGDEKKSYAMLIVDNQYFDTYDIKLKAGANFSDQVQDLGWSKARKIIVNETAAEQLGYTANIVGQNIKWGDNYEVVGVVKDYHHLSLHQFIQPMIFLPKVANGYFTIKMDTRNLANHLKEIKAAYESSFPNEPFTYSFVDELFGKQYSAEQKLGNVFMASAAAAVFIAALGLFGLAAFAAKQKIKEIGIRKVLGATVSNIVGLIAADFIKLVLLAVVIASPIAWYIMNKWLQGYAYRTAIQWWIFVLGGGIAILIAFITVSIQSVKAAAANPVNSLRNE